MTHGQEVVTLLRERDTREDILRQWLDQQRRQLAHRRDVLGEDQVEAQSRELVEALAAAVERSGFGDVGGDDWEPVLGSLKRTAAERARLGLTSSEMAQFVLSLKPALFNAVRRQVSGSERITDDILAIGAVLDQLALKTMEVYQRSREDIIVRQRAEMMELSTPVVTLWEGILALPLIGTLDSERTQTVMESLLQRIVDTGSTIAILDITGVPTVDTLVAQHLLKTVAAARLMGADCIISGIRPQIAQTIVHLGIDLRTVTTKASLAEALAVALDRRQLAVGPRRGGAGTALGSAEG